MKIRPLAIYLPQFHPIPENDAWWGKGFTEWHNVAKSKPKFQGHYQPHLPADLGFYDLRLPEIREAQAELASAHGIYGFCYYHYWFNGKRLLERPFNEVLNSGKPDFPFCLCYANENWTRRWDGKDQHILQQQNYSFEDDRKHIQYLLKVFEDPRYIRIDGKPLFIVYRTELFPDINRTAEIWREEALQAGMGELYLARMESKKGGINPVDIGFDAAIEFQPDWRNLPERQNGDTIQKFLDKLKPGKSIFKENRIYLYEDYVNNILKKVTPDYKCFPGITPQWDNSARRDKNAFILHDSKPEMYEKWLDHILTNFTPFSDQENFIFINAWNEWAEGNHLEPDQRFGNAYLESTKKILLKHRD